MALPQMPRKRTASTDEMRRHIEGLLAEVIAGRSQDDGLIVHWVDADSARVILDEDNAPLELHLPVVRSAADYAVCLHELGHVRGRYQRNDIRHRYPSVSTRERWAWAWARQHALIWVPDMERAAQVSLQSYARPHNR